MVKLFEHLVYALSKDNLQKSERKQRHLSLYIKEEVVMPGDESGRLPKRVNQTLYIILQISVYLNF